MRYEFIGGTSKKFWEIFTVDESAGDYIVRVKYGRIGTAGQENLKVFSYQSGAERYYQEKINEKLKKGYKLIQPTKLEAAYGSSWINKKDTVAVGLPELIAKKSKPKPACEHPQLQRKNGAYECSACKKTVEFDKPQYNTSTPEFETRVRRYFDMGGAA